jgi:hypothetical protein
MTSAEERTAIRSRLIEISGRIKEIVSGEGVRTRGEWGRILKERTTLEERLKQLHDSCGT